MKRKIIKIDEDLCTGCGLCIPGCPEGALQVINGKARLVGEIFCDGLGACLGNCPEGAITVEEREAEPYSEKKTMDNIVKGGEEVIKAHFEHLLNHGQDLYYKEAVAYLEERGIPVPGTASAQKAGEDPAAFKGCKFADLTFSPSKEEIPGTSKDIPDCSGSCINALSHWPIQMHLINPRSPHFKGSDFVLASDCSAFCLGSFHSSILKGKTLGIACPKLDQAAEVYVEKIAALAEEALINTLTVVIMEVACCGGLLRIAQAGLAKSKRKVPVKVIQLGTKGNILLDEWI